MYLLGQRITLPVYMDKRKGETVWKRFVKAFVPSIIEE